VETAVLEALEAIRPALQSDGGDIRVLSLDEETKLLDALHPRFQRFVRFALGTGCRLDEIRGIDRIATLTGRAAPST